MSLFKTSEIPMLVQDVWRQWPHRKSEMGLGEIASLALSITSSRETQKEMGPGLRELSFLGWA